MGFNYEGLQGTAQAQVADKGRNISYISVNGGTYDPSTDAISGDSETTSTIKALFLDFKTNQVDGTIIQADDKLVLIDGAASITPKIDDKITDGYDTYKIVGVKTVKPGGTILLYKLQARR